MRLSIQIVGGNEPAAELPAAGRLVIGSSERADYRLEGQGVADIHCTIGKIKGGGWALKDMGSDYGTFVNAKRVSSARLEHGDEIMLGSKRMRVFDPTRPDGAPAVPAPAVGTTVGGADPPQTGAPVPMNPDEAASMFGGDPGTRAQPGSAPLAPGPGDAGGGARTNLKVSGYKLDHLLGKGGMGEVFLAEQTSLHREVALKVLAPRLEANARFVEQFQAEARSAAALNHPNVVTVYDVGEDGGHHYLSMEYMTRGCLEQRVTELGPLPWREVLDILRDAAAGLVFAESKGIVHRDIKPANLMQNESGTTKIADLGLAVRAEGDESVVGGRLVGTPHFLAPELVRGGAPDSRSDLYSLGATAYRLLSGHTPFDGENSKEILRAALRDDAEPLVDVVAGIPSEFAALVHRLLEKDPIDRFPSAGVLLEEIERLRGGGASSKDPLVIKRRGAGPLVGLGIAAAAVIVALKLVGGGQGPASDGEDGDGEASVSSTAGDTGSTLATGDPSSPFGLPTVEDEPNPDTETERTEIELQLFEANARNALFELRDQVLSDNDRIAALRALAGEYDGTETAQSAAEEANLIEERLATEARASEARESLISDEIRRLRLQAELEQTPVIVGRSLRAVLSQATPSALLGDDEFEQRRRDLISSIVATGVEQSEAALSQADLARDRGDFDEMQLALSTLLTSLDLSDVSTEEVPGTSRLKQVAEAARIRLESIGAMRASFAETRAAQERLLVATSLHQGADFEEELRRLDISAAVTRLEALVEEIVSEGAKAEAQRVLGEMRGAGLALTTLQTTWDAGEWRRKSILDPRKRRASGAEAVGVDREGLLVEEDGAAVTIPWSAWGARPRELEQLFTSRLERSWSMQELSGIAALMRATVVVTVLERLGPAMQAGSGGTFSAKDLGEAIELFEHASEWSQESGTTPQLEAEQDAVQLLGEMLLATEQGLAARAANLIEQLLVDHRSTLTVMLLSDGSDWAFTPAEPADDTQPPEGSGTSETSETSETSSASEVLVPDESGASEDDADKAQDSIR